jgi:hypothetical protein
MNETIMKSNLLLRRSKNLLTLLFLFSFLGLSGQSSDYEITIKGIYGHPQPLWNNGYNLNELGINAIFIHSGSIDSAMIKRARKEGMKVYSEFATLNGKNYVDKHPEAWAINEKGEKVEAASWFMGVCPTEPGFRKYRFNLLRNLLTNFELDGVWMDYVHWHAQFEEPEPILPETCFCDHCLSSFSEDKNIQLPEGKTSVKAEWILKNREKEWRNWRCEVIVEWTDEIRKIMDELAPGALLGIYHCPWTDEEFDGARRRILGLDYDMLRDKVDVFSPMVYHARMGRKSGWVAKNTRWFCERMDIREGEYPKVWPIVQAYNNPYSISADEFETVLTGGMTDCSTGVMMFTTRAMAESEEKIDVMKKIY